MAKDNGFFGNGDGKALAAAVAKRNEIGYAKSRGVAVPNPTIPKPKKSTSLNTTYDLSTYDDDTLLRDSASLGSLLVDSMSGGDRYRSSGDRSDLSRRHSLYNSYLVELKKRGYDTKTADAGSAEMGNFISELNAFSSQFEDEADYDDRYGYYQKYDKSSSSDIEKKIAELSKKGGNEAELNWLKSHRYEYYTTEEMKRLEKELEQRVKQSKENDEALARQTGMFLGADSDDTTSLRTQLAAVQNAIRDNAYAEQAETWDDAHRKIFYDQYGGWLNKISRENQGTRVNAGEMVSGELEAARKGTAEMEEYLKKKGYSDEELRGLRAYAQSQVNLRRYYGNMKYWEGVSDKGFWGKVGATVASIPANLMSGMAFVDSALQGLTNDEDAFTGEKQQVDYNASPLAYAGENMRAAVSKDMSKAGQFFYNTGMSIADFLVARGAMKATGAVGKDIKTLGKIGKGVGNSAEMMLAGSAANSSMRAAKARGATDAEAIGFGFLSGVAEMAGEHASIGHLNTIERAMGNAASKRTVANIFKSIGMQAAVEGSEEGMTTLANTLSDFVIMGDRSEYNLAVKDYIAAGESQEDAKRHALTDWLTGLALDVAAGAISGGVTSGVSIGAGAAHSKVQESVVGWKEKESLHYLLTIDRALNYPESSETRKLAENLAARLDNATTLSEAKITDGEIGKLVKLMSEEESQLEKSDETNTRSAVNPVSAFRAANNAQTATEQPGAAQENAPEPVVVSPTAAAFEAEGISTEDAMERAKILDALLAGEQVSNSQLEKLGSIKDKAGQAAFTAVTGEQIPASVTASGLRKFYREAAAKYAERQKMTADAKESAQQAEADQAVADAAARMETDPAAAFRPPLDTAEQTQYNKKGRSPDVTSIINRLNEGEVPLDEVCAASEIAAAERENRESTPTIELPNREAIQDVAYEQAMAQGSFNGTDYSGPVRQERRIDIVLGLPGSGKSSVYTERISQENGSRVVDTDDYREYIPEYNGQNAGAVHEEASAIKKRVLTRALKNGDNIILSTIGANAQKLERDIIGYNGMGYSVHLHLNELPNHKAMARAIGRFLPEDGSQGRFVSPKVIAEYGDKPTQTYLYLTGRSDINGIRSETADPRGNSGSGGEMAQAVREGRGYDQRGRAGSTGVVSRTPAGAEITSYDWYNNDVEFGQPPILVESSDTLSEPKYDNAEKIKLDDGTELTREEFGEQIRKIVPDATELEIDTAFVEGLESSETVETEEISAEGHTERVIAENAAEELIGDVRGAEYVTVDEGIKLGRGQMWLAKFLANSLRKTGVVERVEITDKFGANIEGAIQNDVLYLSSKNVTPSYIAQKTIGHELFHAAVDKITKNAVRDTAMVNDVLESFAEIAEDFDLDKRIKERTDAYKSAYAAQTNSATGKPYTATEINLLINEEYIREEIAADVMGDVFAKQRMLNDMAGLRPGIIARAYLAAEKVKNFRANSTSEAKAVKRHAKETQSKLLAALEMSGSYEVENGESIVRTSVSDKSWEKQMELGFVALGLRNVDGYTAADYASAREELGDSCFIMKDVPAILQEIGLGKKPLTYTQTHFVNATLPIERNAQGVRVSHAHGIDEDTIARLPKLLSRPAMVLRSRQQSKTSGGMSDAIIIIVDAYDSEGSPVGVVVLPNGEAVVDGVRGAANPILSVYGFEDLNSSDAGRNMLRTARDSNGFLYVNSELTDKMLRKIGQKKSAEPINSPETTGKEYSANEVVANAASRIRSTQRSFSPRPDGLTAAEQPESPSPQRSTSSIKMVSQTERVVNSRYKALAANPYLHGVELDKVTSLTADHDTPASAVRVLPESLMRSEYKSGGELLRWTREGEVWVADETGGGTSYLNMSSPLIIDCGGADATQLGEISGGRGGSIEAIRDYVYASEMQYDGIVLRNLNTDGRVADTAITLTDSQVIPVEPRETVTVGGARYSVTEHEYAPTFYSKLERAIETQKQDKFGANSVVNMLRGKGIKSEEIKWSGINTFLDGKKSVTKDELLGFLRDNQLQIDTVELSDDLHGQRVVQFSDHDGVLAHARAQDVIGADGGKVLFVGEIQSDRSNGEHSGYTDFVLKNLIRDAAENGYTQIAWTTGAQQEARWSSEYAEGYRVEYDQDIPSFLKKYGKQWGATVGYTVIGCDLTRTGAYLDGGMGAVMTIALNEVDETGRLSNGAYVVHSMDITDAMKQSVLYDGQTRFSVKASDFGFTGEVRAARGVRLNGEEKRAISSKIMSGDAQIDGIRGTARTFDYEYTFEVYSDGSVEITDVISNEDINRLIESDRRRQKNAERLGSGRSNARRLYTTRPDAGGEADVSERHNDRGRGKRSSETYGREPGRDIPRSGDGEQENTRQTDVDPETEALFSAENALRFAVSGANMDTLIQNMLRRRVSKVRTNTFKRSGIFTRAELAMEGLREKDMQYNVASEKQSMEDAQQRLTADYEGEKTRLFQNGEEWKPTDLDAAMGVISQELDAARQNGDYREVIKWAQLVRSKGTQAGQLVQAFAKYTRTPEGVLIRAAEDLSRSTLSAKQQKELLDRIAKFSETLEAIQTGDKEALIQLILKQAKQRNTPVSKKTLAAMRADTTDFKFLYDTAITQLDQIAKDYIKTNFGRKVSTFQTLAHLLNLRTAGRNLGSNNIFSLVDSAASDAAMLPDLMLSLITGERKVGLDRSRLSKAAREGAKDARNRSRIEVALDVAPNDRRDKYGTSRRTWKMTGNWGSRMMSRAEKALGFELNYTDESAKGAIRAQIKQSLQPYVDNGTMTEAEADYYAEQEALYRTFQDDNFISTVLSGIVKPALNTIGFGGATPLIKGKDLKTHDFGLGDIVVKYTQVPGALISRAIEFSPAGYVKALHNLYQMFKSRHELAARTDLTDEKRIELKLAQDTAQRKAALFIGRATTGIGLIKLFAALASAGLLHRGDDEDDPDAKALAAAMGMSGTQLNISAMVRSLAGEGTEWREGDELASLDFLEPLNSLMAIGTLVARSDDAAGLGEIAVKSLPALMNAFSELSVMQTLRTIVDTSTYYTPDSGLGVEDEAWDRFLTVSLNVALSGATGFVPAPVRQLAQATDSSNRDAYSERGVWAKTAAQIKNTIPGLRETLPEKLTNFGEPKPTENAFLRAVNAFLMPGTVSTYKPSSAADELADVYDSTDDANIYPDRNAPYKLTITSDGEKTEYALTPEERSTYQRVRGQLSKELIDAARASAAYQQGSAMEKAEMLTTAKNYANYVAKKACLASRGVEYSDATYENYGEMLQSGVDLSSYLAYSAARNDLEADKDDNGDAISGTKKAKTLDLIGSLDMSSGQKSALYFKAYPDEQDEFDDLGIDFDEYYTYSRAMCTLTGDKDANGKTISGSKKAKVVSLIDSLDIPSEAKTKLYLQNGYSAKNIPSWS